MGFATNIRSGVRSSLAGGVHQSNGPTFRATGAIARGTGALSPAWPTHQTNDVGFLCVFNAHTATMAAPTLSVAAGFVSIGSVEGTFGGLFGRLTVFWARASSGAMGAPTSTAVGSWSAAWITSVRGAITTGNPHEASQTSFCNVGSSLPFNAVGVTTLGADRFALVLAGAFVNSGASNAKLDSPSNTVIGIDEHLNNIGISGTENTLAGVWSGSKNTTGTTGTTTGTYNASYSIWAAMTLAIKP